VFQKPNHSAKAQIPKNKLIPHLKSNIILSEDRRAQSIKAIEEHLMFSVTQMHQMVNPLFKQIAQSYQLLPSTQHPFYIAPGGLIDYALYRAEAAMMIFKQSALPPHTTELSIAQARIAYVLCSTALLKGIGCIYTDFHIDTFNQNGRYVSTWEMLWDEFPETAEFYFYDIISTKDDELKNQLTPIIAKNLMPITGLKWISEDSDTLLLWLKLLHEEYEGFHVLEAILERSEALAWQRMAEYALSQTPLHDPISDARTPGFIDSGGPNPQYLEIIGLMFLKWLHENLARGQMLINDSPLIAAEKGIVVTSEAFKWFVQQHPQFKNWRLIQQGLMALGLHDQQSHEQNNLLIKKIGYLLPKEVFAKQFQNQQHFKIQSMNLMHQWKNYTQGKQLNLEQLEKQLQANGQWEVSPIAPSLSSKNV
jgi:hypothetical protein